jgi:hypothetical protein
MIAPSGREWASKSVLKLQCGIFKGKCRASGARLVRGVWFPALPGWADVWRSALRAYKFGTPNYRGI